MTKVYLAGPMRGIKDFNFPAFRDASTKLRTMGYTVFDPAERDLEEWGDGFNISENGNLTDIPKFDLRLALSDCLSWICEEADAIVVLPGWEHSLGANAEIAAGRAVGIEVFTLEEVLSAAG